jgi:hypothetical protein
MWTMSLLAAFFSYDDPNRSRVVIVAGVVDLRTVRNDCKHIHLCSQSDERSRGRIAAGDLRGSRAIYGHSHEEIDVGNDIAPAHAMLRQRLEEVLPAARALLDAIEHKVARRAASSSNRIVRAVAVFDDAEKRVRLVGVENMSLGERYRAGGLDRVRRKIALACVICVVAEEVDGLSAFTVNDPQMLPLLDDAAPGHLRRDDLVENNPFFLHPRNPATLYRRTVAGAIAQLQARRRDGRSANNPRAPRDW